MKKNLSSLINTSRYSATKISEAAKTLGVSTDTLRRWEKSGKISSLKTPGGTRLYHQFVKIGEAAKMLGVSIDTLRRWEKTGKISTLKTPGGTRLYAVNELQKINPGATPLSNPPVLPEPEFTAPAKDSLTDLIAPSPDDLFTKFSEEEMKDAVKNPKTKKISSSFHTAIFITTGSLLSLGLILINLFTLSSHPLFSSYFTPVKGAKQILSQNISDYFFSPKAELAITPQNLLKTAVLGEQTTKRYLEINADTLIFGDLAVDKTINGLILTPKEEGFTISGGTATPHTLTVNGDVTLPDQNLSGNSSPTFKSINLSDASKQIVFQSGGPTGTLTWTPTSARIITLPDVTTTLIGTDTTQTITNKTISGSSNTLSSIPNSALSNSKVTVTAGTNLTGGGDISLGSSGTLSLKDDITITTLGVGSSKFTVSSTGDITKVNNVTYTWPTSAAAGSNYVLSSNTSGTLSWAAVSGVGGVSGTGTTNYLSKFTDTSTIGNSLLYDDGTNIGIGTASPNNKLEVLSTTTPQLRLAYDGTAYFTTSVAATTGAVTFDTNGSTPSFTFSDSLTANTFSSSNVTITGGSITGITDLAVADGGTGLSTIAAGSILAANTLDTLSAVTSTTGLKVLQNSAGTVSWASTTGTGNVVYDTSPSITTPTINTSLTVTDDDWIGLSSSTARIEFDDQATDEINILSANVGIGTTIPAKQLHVYNSADYAYGIFESAEGGGNWLGYFSSGTYGPAIYWKNGSALRFGTSTNNIAETDWSEKMRITTNGDLGIATTTPGKALDINSATGTNLRLTYNDADGSAVNYTDFSLGSAGDLTITGSAVTLADGATAEKTFLTLTPGIITLTGPTQVTSVMDTSIITGATIAATNATTVNDAANLTLTAPVDSTNTTLTRSEALRINDTTSGAGTLTSLIGLYIAPQTGGATNNYGICFDCDGTWTSSTVASGIQFGTDANAVNLYRSANDTLKTDDALVIGGTVTITSGSITGITDVAVADGGTGLSTIAAGSILAANTIDTLSAVTSTSGLKVLQNSDGTVSWASTTGTGNVVYDTSPSLTTPTINTSLTVTDDDWIGLSSSTARIEFDDQATDEVNILNANVGIGTTDPGFNKLEVNSTAGNSPAIYGLNTSTIGGYGIWGRATADTAGTKIGVYGDVSGTGTYNYAGYFEAAGGTNNWGIYVAAGNAYLGSGKVGIVTTAPDAALEINHATGDNLRLTYNDSDGSAVNYTDFSLSATGALTLTGSAATLGASATAEKTFLTLTPGAVTLTAPTQVTSLMETAVLTGATLAADASLTIDKATTLSLTAPIDSTNVTLTDSSGLRILNTTSGAGTLTNQYGLYIEDMTAGGSDYGIAIEGADTAALWISSAADNTDAANGITFGLSKDTNLYRSAANTLKTDDALVIGGTVTITSGSITGITDLAVADGGTGLSTIAAGSILAANTIDTLSAVTSTSGLKVLQNSDGTVSWASTTGTGNVVYDTSPSITTPTINTSLTVTDDDWIGLSSSTARIEFDDQATDEINILSANVGIGTTAPASLVDIYSTNPTLRLTDSTALAKSLLIDVDADIAQFREVAGATGSLLTLDLANNRVGIGTTAPAAKFDVAGTNSTIANSTGDITFTSAQDVVFNLTNGNVGIGTTAPARSLETTGSIRMGALITGGGSAVAMYQDANGDLATSTSSQLYKTNIQPYSSVLEKVMQLDAVTFQWNELTPTPGAADFGMVAEQVNPILPDLVTYKDDGVTPIGLKYEKMGLIALKAIQEQQGEINALTSQLNNLNLSLNSQGSLVVPQLKTDHLIISADVQVDGLLGVKEGSLAADSALVEAKHDYLDIVGSLVGLDTKLSTQTQVLSAQVASASAEAASASAALTQTQSQTVSLAAQLASAAADLVQTKKDVADLKLTAPEVLIATESAHLANIEVTSDATISGKLAAYEATISETFKALGQTFLGNTTIAGDLSVDGTMSISGSSLSTLGTLFLQNGSLAENIDFFNGKLTIDKNGNITTAGEVKATTIVTNKLTISNTPIASSSAAIAPSIGSGTIPIGQKEVAIFTNVATQNSRIFITPRSSTAGQAPYISTIVDGTGFVVSIDNALDHDINFDWWLVETK